jgi:hypothetical protein
MDSPDLLELRSRSGRRGPRNSTRGGEVGERLSDWRPRDWPDLAVELLLAGIDDLEIAELAGLPASVTGWETDPLVTSLYEKHSVPLPDPEEAVTLLARLMATNLRLRPATVTAPMIRIVAGLALEAPESDLAN